jgi:hypothetical protein
MKKGTPAQMGGMAGRAIPIVNLAIGYAVQQHEAPEVRAAAVRYVVKAIEKHRGSTIAICEELGVSTGTFSRWVRSCKELQDAQYSWRDESTGGRVPQALTKKRRRTAKS